jgi:hypothetical protein
VPATAVPDPDEQQITLADVDVLGRLRGGQVTGGDMIAGLQPPHPPDPGNVEQQATADDPVAGHLDGQLGRSARGDSGRGHVVVEHSVEEHVA